MGALKYTVILAFFTFLLAQWFDERPLKVLILNSIISATTWLAPNPQIDPQGWIEYVRSVQDPNFLFFRHIFHASSNKYEDRKIKLSDGRFNYIRVFKPNQKEKSSSLPIFVWFHGGGYVFGNYSYENQFLEPLSQQDQLKVIVISVDYRLAPENKFPAAVIDADLSLEWIHNNARNLGGNPNQIFIGGESAGATISTVLAFLSRENIKKYNFKGLYLSSPGFLLLGTKSYKKYKSGYVLSESWIEVFTTSYVQNISDWANPLASPTQNPNFSGLPHTLVHIAELDMVKDGAISFCQRLYDENFGKVSWKIFEGVSHAGLASFRWLFTKQSNEALVDLTTWIGDILKHMEK